MIMHTRAAVGSVYILSQSWVYTEISNFPIDFDFVRSTRDLYKTVSGSLLPVTVTLIFGYYFNIYFDICSNIRDIVYF